MSWSYGNAPDTTTAAGKRDAVRLFAEENDTTNQRVTNEEIDFLLTQEANVYMAAAACCELVAARIGPISMKRVGDLVINYNESYYREHAAFLRARGQTYQTLSVGGVSVSDKQVLEGDDDWLKFRFHRNLHDYLGAAGTPIDGTP